jgi:hypothetical protein
MTYWKPLFLVTIGVTQNRVLNLYDIRNILWTTVNPRNQRALVLTYSNGNTETFTGREMTDLLTFLAKQGVTFSP